MATGGAIPRPSTAPGDQDFHELNEKILFQALHPMAAKYLIFGIQIDVRMDEIEKIQTQFTNPDKCLLKILSIRLKMIPPLTWNDVDAALRSDAVGESRLANKIKKKYGHLYSPDRSLQVATSDQEHGRKKGKRRKKAAKNAGGDEELKVGIRARSPRRPIAEAKSEDESSTNPSEELSDYKHRLKKRKDMRLPGPPFPITRVTKQRSCRYKVRREMLTTRNPILTQKGVAEKGIRSPENKGAAMPLEYTSDITQESSEDEESDSHDSNEDEEEKDSEQKSSIEEEETESDNDSSLSMTEEEVKETTGKSSYFSDAEVIKRKRPCKSAALSYRHQQSDHSSRGLYKEQEEYDNEPKRRRHRESSMSTTAANASSSSSTSQEQSIFPRGKGRRKGRNSKNISGKRKGGGKRQEDSSNENKSSSESEVNIFERFFGQLCCKISNPVETAAELQRKGLISISMMRDMITSPESETAKTISLVDDVNEKIKSRPDCLFVFIEVLLEDEALQCLGKEMLKEIGK